MRRTTSVPDYVFSSLVINVLIPLREVRIWKLVKKYLVHRPLGVLQSAYHVRVNQTFRYYRVFSHEKHLLCFKIDCGHFSLCSSLPAACVSERRLELVGLAVIGGPLSDVAPEIVFTN